jgi:heterogeneous nuclear ribonucleoprotein A1/A3
MTGAKLHIGNLESRTTAATLTAAFQRDGRNVLTVTVVKSRDPDHSRGFAFVEMANEAEALAAMTELHGTDIDGRIVRVSRAHPPKSRYGGYRPQH